ncbi:MAG: hypothetical protein K8S54_01335 [Spirochaetia bacterium]|nr:hypothetical protein [Spirochaetia bacterium]
MNLISALTFLLQLQLDWFLESTISSRTVRVGSRNVSCDVYIESLVNTLIGRPDTDEYGRLILLRNFISLSIGKRPQVERALELAVLDNYFKNKSAAFPEFESSMRPRERTLLRRLREDTQFRLYHWKRIVRVHLPGCNPLHNNLIEISRPYTRMILFCNRTGVPGSDAQGTNASFHLNFLLVISRDFLYLTISDCPADSFLHWPV